MFDDRKEQIRINTILQWDCKQQYRIYEETDDIVTNCLGFKCVKFNYELNQCLYQTLAAQSQIQKTISNIIPVLLLLTQSKTIKNSVWYLKQN